MAFESIESALTSRSPRVGDSMPVPTELDRPSVATDAMELDPRKSCPAIHLPLIAVALTVEKFRLAGVSAVHPMLLARATNVHHRMSRRQWERGRVPGYGWRRRAWVTREVAQRSAVLRWVALNRPEP